MATPYLGLDETAVAGTKFNLKKMNDNTQKIEEALFRKRADLPDRVQIGADWFVIAPTQKDWEIYTGDIAGNKIVRHGVWALVEMQFKALKAITIPSNGNPVSNSHMVTIEDGYRSMNKIALTGINSPIDMAFEIHPNGNGYITAYNHTSTTIPKDTIIRIGGRYVFVP